jgi:hypothetical protein
MGVFASLFFSVPTAALIWLGINKELAYWGGFLGTSFFWGSLAVGAGVALLAPRLLPSLLGAIWKGFMRIEKWWGW